MNPAALADPAPTAESRLKDEQERLDALRTQRPELGEAGKAARDLVRAIDLAEFAEALRRAVALGLSPDLNDGVVLTIAPLQELVSWPVAGQYWNELRAGKYEWSSMRQQLRVKGMVRGQLAMSDNEELPHAADDFGSPWKEAVELGGAGAEREPVRRAGDGPPENPGDAASARGAAGMEAAGRPGIVRAGLRARGYP